MDPASAPCQSRDILSRPGLAFLVFYLPAIAIVASGFFALSNIWRTILWTVALAVMGRACLVNALRCGRIHCYLTGPFFLVMALASLSYGLGLLPLGRNGWNLIGLVLFVACRSCFLEGIGRAVWSAVTITNTPVEACGNR